jgi:non-canonical (house-cleaning) NTP pyrophosphatase
MDGASHHTISLVVGTTSAIKLAAIRSAFAKASAAIGPLFQAESVQLDLISTAAKSEINEQPIGWEETIKGANNRAKNALTLAPAETKPRLVIAVENGCVELPANGPNYFMDIGWVILRDLNINKDFVSSSTSLTVPGELLESLKDVGGPKVSTIGDVLHARDSSIPTKDPHSVLLGGVLERTAMLEQALLSCIGQWIYHLKSTKS